MQRVPPGSHTSYSSSLVGATACENHGETRYFDGGSNGLEHLLAKHRPSISRAVFVTYPGWGTSHIQPEEERKSVRLTSGGDIQGAKGAGLPGAGRGGERLGLREAACVQSAKQEEESEDRSTCVGMRCT